MSQEQKSRFYGKVGFLPLKVSTSAYFAPPPWPRCWFQNKLSFIGFSICWLFILFGVFFHILVFLVLKVCVSAELAPLPSLQEPAVPLPLSISCSERGLFTLWGPEHSNKVFKTLFECHHRQFLAQRESAPNIMGTRGFKHPLIPFPFHTEILCKLCAIITVYISCL